MIVIHKYRADWPDEFAAIGSALAETLGSLALQIDHIGSTSVPGLGAKDVIDVQITVAALTSEIRERMVAAGYVFRESLTHDHVPAGEDDDPRLWTKMVFTESPGRRRAMLAMPKTAKGGPSPFDGFIARPACIRPYAAAGANLKQPACFGGLF